jgi:hypothetical protein
MGTMMNKIIPPVSSVTQHCFASEKKPPLAFDGLQGKIMNQKHLMLPFAPTSCASFLSQETQHCFASDKKGTSLAFDASKSKLMNQKNLMLPFAPTSCASFLSQEIPSFDTNNYSASFSCQNTFTSAESKLYGSNSKSISKNTSFSSHHGSNSISSLSSTTATSLRTVPFTMIPFEKKNIQKNA